MSLREKLNSEIQEMNWVDLLFIELSDITLGILIVILIPGLIDLNPLWVFTAFVILVSVPLYRVVKRNKNQEQSKTDTTEE